MHSTYLLQPILFISSGILMAKAFFMPVGSTTKCGPLTISSHATCAPPLHLRNLHHDPAPITTPHVYSISYQRDSLASTNSSNSAAHGDTLSVPPSAHGKGPMIVMTPWGPTQYFIHTKLKIFRLPCCRSSSFHRNTRKSEGPDGNNYHRDFCHQELSMEVRTLPIS